MTLFKGAIKQVNAWNYKVKSNKTIIDIEVHGFTFDPKAGTTTSLSTGLKATANMVRRKAAK